MSYYENVYLPRLNHNGTTRQERILASKAKQFEEGLLKTSLYRVEFTVGLEPRVGSLQPGKQDEKEVLSHLLLPIGSTLSTGDVVTINSNKWLVTFYDHNTMKGYNLYKVFLLDRTLTWWDRYNATYTASINLCSSMKSTVADTFVKGTVSYRQQENPMQVLMAYDPKLMQDCYAKINGSDRRFTVSGFDCETVPGVAYVTLDITMARDDASETTRPSSFWETTKPSGFWGV